MKLTYLTLFVLLTLGFVSCRKDKNDIGIVEYDDQQINAYIKANGLTNMQRANDTTGIYYEILTPGKGAAFTPSDTISYVFSVKTLDGSYNLSDTIAAHVWSFAGLIVPKGVQLAVNNLLKTKGTRARFLIPSRLAYGINGTGTGVNRIGGNQSLLYYINIIDNQEAYDDMVIQNYFKNNNINPAEYTKITSGTYRGLYYKIRKVGTRTTLITESSNVTVYYKGQTLNNVVFAPTNYSSSNLAASNLFDLNDPSNSPVLGFKQGLMLGQKEGTDLTVIMPSRLGYGRNASTAIPANSCLYFDISIGAVTNP